MVNKNFQRQECAKEAITTVLNEVFKIGAHRVFVEVNMILETERLYLREMKQSDFDSLCKILKDEDTM